MDDKEGVSRVFDISRLRRGFGRGYDGSFKYKKNNMRGECPISVAFIQEVTRMRDPHAEETGEHAPLCAPVVPADAGK